jgi:TonB family protein
MRFLMTLLVCCGVGFACLGQAAGGDGAGLPKDPREVFAAAAPFYDFSDPAMKPWHLKASYQLYDADGKAGEQGIYEYWWASPQAYRSTWTRASATYTEWHTADGKNLYLASGDALRFFEFKLQTALFSPLPEAGELDSGNLHLDRQKESAKGAKMPCIMLDPMRPGDDKADYAPLGLFPTYCFDPQIPVLRTSYSFEGITSQFNKIVKTQGKYLAQEVLFFEETNKVLSAEVGTIEGLAVSDPALVPSPDAKAAKLFPVIPISGGVAQGLLLKKTSLVYPQDAKAAHASGRVILQATIGTDGKVHDLRVVSAPFPSLAASALSCVSKWEYKPYVLDGVPIEVETTINVIFTLGD